jgi:crotonobetainyl-CoA:carnitine CoA-transferase CaiB-like acyl-CoA transferase
MAIAANSQDMWRRLCRVTRPELAEDERFAEPFGRARNKEALVAVLAEVFATRPASEWETLLTEADVPNARILDYAGLADHPQFLANGYIQEIEHPNLGKMRVPGPPLHMSETPPRVQGGGPELGQHTEELLLEAGYSWDELEAFRREGVI